MARRRLLPDSASVDVPRVIVARALRGFADGFVSVVLAVYLTTLGFSPLQVGAIVTGTLLGSAALTLGTGLVAHRWELRTLLLAACVLMTATGIGFMAVTGFWALMVIAVVGTLNPSAGDVSVFLPTEQAYLAGHVTDLDRPHLYAMYNLAGAFAGAFGALASGLPERIAGCVRRPQGRRAARELRRLRRHRGRGLRRLPRGSGGSTSPPTSRPSPASRSRSRAARCSSSRRCSRSTPARAASWCSRCSCSGSTWSGGSRRESPPRCSSPSACSSAFSQLLAGPLARRIGLVRTMVFTHLPANLFLVLAAFAPTAAIAIGCLLVRALFSQMDVPARQALVMAVVTPEERRRGRERHQRPAQPRVGGDAAARRGAAQGDDVRLAADHRRASGRRPTTWCCWSGSAGSASGRGTADLGRRDRPAPA